ncbi:MAG: ATP-binding protein [Candidatus Alcyoniella australis]|nr:ATP-binding protein [Candidatus Alcyoniella australis]
MNKQSSRPDTPQRRLLKIALIVGSIAPIALAAVFSAVSWIQGSSQSTRPLFVTVIVAAALSLTCLLFYMRLSREAIWIRWREHNVRRALALSVTLGITPLVILAIIVPLLVPPGSDSDTYWRLLMPLTLLSGLIFLLSYVLVRRLWTPIERTIGMLDGVINGEQSPPQVNALGPWNDIEERIRSLAELLTQKRSDLESKLRNKLQGELVAEQRRTEAFLRSIGDGITIVDRDMRIIYVNDAIRDVFGDHRGHRCHEVYEHRAEPCPGCPVLASFETGEVPRSLRRVYDKHGRLQYYENTGSPIVDETGEIIAGIELARDVTQRIKLQRSVEAHSRELAVANEELRQTNEQLQSAYEELKRTQSQLYQTEKMASLGILVAGIAHEINNPLNFIYGSMQLMDENVQALVRIINELEKIPMADQDHERIEQIKEEVNFEYVYEDLTKIVKNVTRGAERMKTIVQDLRTFSRVDKMEMGTVDIHEGVESTLNLLFHEYKNKVEIVREFGELPTVIGNAGKLNQVFMNVLHNAIQSIDSPGTITIKTHAQDDHVIVEISDSGRGIDEEKLKQIFDPFFTTKKVGDGTGLGLSISDSIIRDHRGRISATSVVGTGTTMRIELPLDPQSKAA